MVLVGPPAVSCAVVRHRAIGGVMITASHNPPTFNGFKLKSHYGGSADAATCRAVEKFLDKKPVRTGALSDAARAARAASSSLRISPAGRLNLMPLRSSGMWLPVTMIAGTAQPAQPPLGPLPG